MISSYFASPGVYFAIFGLPNVQHPFKADAVFGDDDYVSNAIGTRCAVYINNALSKLGGCDYLILAWLSDVQRSYLHPTGRARIVTIASLSEVVSALAGISEQRAGEVRCTSKQVLLGLQLAVSSGAHLVIDDDASALIPPPPREGGAIVVEEALDNIGSVAAINFACSVAANLHFVSPLEANQPQTIREQIRCWKDAHSDADYQAIRQEIARRIGGIDLSGSPFVTFVTEGLPYSLGIANVAPCSYIDLFSADHFVYNCIMSERDKRFNVATIFSTEEFIKDSEVQWLLPYLHDVGYITRTLLGPTATVQNLDYNTQHFPYSLLHISSHGGRIEGYEIFQEFTDRTGTVHSVQYEEVPTITRVAGTDKFEVVRKTFPKALDGLKWRSQELALNAFRNTSCRT